MVFFQNVFWVLVLIGVMILVHELGHFMAARFFDVKVETFSFGFGPRLFGVRGRETDYRISAIPFGGYVRMAGEQPGDESLNDPRGFLAHPRWQRLVIAFAGPLMNMMLAVVVLTGLFMVKYEKVAEPEVRGLVGYVAANSPAAKAGIREGDRIIRIDGLDDPSWEDITLKEMANTRKSMPATVERNGSRFETQVTPAQEDRTGIGAAGWAESAEIQVGKIVPGMPAEKAGMQKGDLLVSAKGEPLHSLNKFHELIRGSNGTPVEIQFLRDGRLQTVTVYPQFSKIDGAGRWMIGVNVEPRWKIVSTRLPLPAALKASLSHNVKNATVILQLLRGILERRMSAKSLEGPIRIAQISGEAAREGPIVFLMLMSTVSLNLAIFNLLPIPILDGGVILLVLVEMVIRRDLSLAVKETVFKLGFAFILVLVAFVLYNDLAKVLPAG